MARLFYGPFMSTPFQPDLVPDPALPTLQRRLMRLLNKALRDFSLLSTGDNLLVALSGGKDSLCLTELLALRSRIRQPRFSVAAVHVRMENVQYETDTQYLQAFCQRLNVPLHILTTRFETDTKAGRSPCYLCSWTRRKAIFRLALEQGYNKIALGHHQDDLLLTLLMNQVFEGSFDTMPALLQFRKMPLTLIRPLCRIPEELIATWSQLNHYEKQVKICPFEHESNRTRIQSIWKSMQQLNPEARYSLWHALEKEHKLVELSPNDPDPSQPTSPI